jgi:hypothetical protein
MPGLFALSLLITACKNIGFHLWVQFLQESQNYMARTPPAEEIVNYQYMAGPARENLLDLRSQGLKPAGLLSDPGQIVTQAIRPTAALDATKSRGRCSKSRGINFVFFPANVSSHGTRKRFGL